MKSGITVSSQTGGTLIDLKSTKSDGSLKRQILFFSTGAVTVELSVT
jgi:hypothetical protein